MSRVSGPSPLELATDLDRLRSTTGCREGAAAAMLSSSALPELTTTTHMSSSSANAPAPALLRPDAAARGARGSEELALEDTLASEADPLTGTRPGLAATDDATDDTIASAPLPIGAAAEEPEALDQLIARGATVGRYVVLEKLGAGAMGVVLAAYDPQLDRKVALKLLKASTDQASTARVRLQREAQALAKLDHPNVVAVHDVGVHQGQLFVGMEFVNGQTLGAWMRAGEGPRPWREVLRVFIDAGRGLAAAHEAGLVHRDFKPENVMIGEGGRVRVMDFGLARAMDDFEDDLEAVRASASASANLGRERALGSGARPLSSRMTQTGALMGTPAYMSLEQFYGRSSDARSDQFSFCVAFYEALYGQRPYAGATVGALLRSIKRRLVTPAPKGASVPPWIRRVVLRGLAPEPAERWPSMQALLAALAHDPASRRRARWRTAASLVLVGAAAGGLVYAAQASARRCAGMEAHLAGTWDPERRAAVREAITATGLSYAPATWERVERRLDDYARRWLSARVDACEASRRGEQSGALLDARMACLDERLQRARATIEVLSESEEAAAAVTVNKAVELVAELPRLERCADAAALSAEVAPPEDPAVARRVEQHEATLAKAAALTDAGRYADGLALLDALLPEAEALGYEPLVVRARLRHGLLLEGTRDYQAAEQTLERCYAAALGLRMLEEAATAATYLVSIVGATRFQPEAGRRWAVHAEPLARAVGTPQALTEFALNLGIVALQEGEHDEALELFERALTTIEAARGPETLIAGIALTNLGNAASAAGRLSASRGYHERAVGILARELGEEHPNVAAALNNLGLVAWREGQYLEARRSFERARGIYERSHGREHPLVAFALNGLGMVAWKQREHAEARAHYQRAIELLTRAPGFESLSAHPLTNLGSVAYSEGRYAEARGHHLRALELFEGSVGPEHPSLGFPLTGLGKAYLAEGSAAAALPHLERAHAIYDPRTSDALELADADLALARALWTAPVERGRDRARARALAEDARRLYAGAGARAVSELARAETWLKEHILETSAERAAPPPPP